MPSFMELNCENNVAADICIKLTFPNANSDMLLLCLFNRLLLSCLETVSYVFPSFFLDVDSCFFT